jgi:hypothetical protein
MAARSGSAAYAASIAADGCVWGHNAPVIMTVTPASRIESGSPSSGTQPSIKVPSAVMAAMLARLYWAATWGETFRSSTAAWALIRSHSMGRDASVAASAAASWPERPSLDAAHGADGADRADGADGAASTTT